MRLLDARTPAKLAKAGAAHPHTFSLVSTVIWAAKWHRYLIHLMLDWRLSYVNVSRPHSITSISMPIGRLLYSHYPVTPGLRAPPTCPPVISRRLMTWTWNFPCIDRCPSDSRGGPSKRYRSLFQLPAYRTSFPWKECTPFAHQVPSFHCTALERSRS